MPGKRSTQIGRRAFVKAASSIAGALLAPSLALDESHAASSHPVPVHLTGRLQVDVLLPQSLPYPDLGASFLSGMRFYRTQMRNRPPGLKVTFTPVNYQTRYDVLEQARSLIEESKADLLVAVSKSSGVAQLRWTQMPWRLREALFRTTSMSSSSTSLYASTHISASITSIVFLARAVRI